jgi:hypothetical protein
MAAFVPAGGLAMGIHRVVTDPDDSPNRPLALTMFFVFFALFYSGLCWFAFVWPRTRYLRLHENGISGKWRWKKFAVRFEDIQYLVVGVRSSVIVDCFLKAVSFIFPPTKSVIEVRKQAFANSVSLLLRDGRKVHFGYLFVWFEASEVIRLLEVLSSRVRVHSGYPGS